MFACGGRWDTVLTIQHSATLVIVHVGGWLTNLFHAFFMGLLAPYFYFLFRGPAPMVVLVSRAWGLLLVPAMRAVHATALHDALSGLVKCILNLFEEPMGRLLVAVFFVVPAYRMYHGFAREKGVSRDIGCLLLASLLQA